MFSRLSKFFQEVPKCPSGEPIQVEFKHVLSYWKIPDEEKAIRRLILKLRMRSILSAFVIGGLTLTPCFPWKGSFFDFAVLGLAAFFFVSTLMMYSWHISILANRKFVFFPQWLLRRR